MDEFMDTVDPRLDPPSRGKRRPVHMPTYYARWAWAGVLCTLVIAVAAAAAILA